MAKARQEVVQLQSGRFAGRWMVKVKLEELTASGHHKEKRVMCNTQREALEEKRKIEREIARGTFSTERTLLSSYISDWLEQKKSEVKERTVEQYAECFRRYLLPRLGKVQMGKLTTPQAQKALGDISSEVSASCSNRCRTALHAALQDAWRSRLIPLNPVTVIRKKKTEAREKTLWTDEQLGQFLESVGSHRLYPAFHLAAVTGLRRGELLGVRWSDLEKSALSIRQQVAPAKRGERKDTPKGERSKRRMFLDLETLGVLERWKAVQQGERKELGAAWGADVATYGDLIFTSEAGGVINPHNFSRLWRDLRKKAGVPEGMTFHNFRDLNGSQLLAEGFSPNEVADRLGHEPAVLLKTYAHSRPERSQAMAKPIGERFSNGVPKTLN